MRTLGKAIRTARAEQKDWQKEPNNFLRTIGLHPTQARENHQLNY